MPTPRCLCDFRQGAGDAAACRIAQNVNVVAGASEEHFDQTVESCGIAGDFGFKFQPFTNRHDGDAMDCNRSADDNLVACLRASRMNVRPLLRTSPIPEVFTKILSALPRSTTLVSPVTSLNSGFVGCVAHRLDDSPEILHRRSFFEDETDTRDTADAPRTSRGRLPCRGPRVFRCRRQEKRSDSPRRNRC